MSQIQHLDFASKRFPFCPPSLRRVLGWADQIWRETKFRDKQPPARARELGEACEAPSAQKRKEALCTRWTPKVRAPFILRLRASLASPWSQPCFYCHPFLNIPQSHHKLSPPACLALPVHSPKSWGVQLAKGPRRCHRPPARPPGSGAPAHPAHPALQRESPTPGPPPPLLLPDTPPSPRQTRS